MKKRADGTAGRMAATLAVLCLAGFWILPLAPLAAMGAVKATDGTAGWARRAAVAAAALCSIYTLAMAILIARLYFAIPS